MPLWPLKVLLFVNALHMYSLPSAFPSFHFSASPCDNLSTISSTEATNPLGQTMRGCWGGASSDTQSTNCLSKMMDKDIPRSCRLHTSCMHSVHKTRTPSPPRKQRIRALVMREPHLQSHFGAQKELLSSFL